MPEAHFRGQLAYGPPLSRRGCGRVRAERHFPARDPEANERYRWRATLHAAVLRPIENCSSDWSSTRLTFGTHHHADRSVVLEDCELHVLGAGASFSAQG